MEVSIVETILWNWQCCTQLTWVEVSIVETILWNWQCCTQLTWMEASSCWERVKLQESPSSMVPECNYVNQVIKSRAAFPTWGLFYFILMVNKISLAIMKGHVVNRIICGHIGCIHYKGWWSFIGGSTALVKTLFTHQGLRFCIITVLCVLLAVTGKEIYHL